MYVDYIKEYICITYTYTYTQTYTHNIYSQKHTYTHTHTFTHIHTHIRTYTHTYASERLYIYIYIYMCVCIPSCLHYVLNLNSYYIIYLIYSLRKLSKISRNILSYQPWYTILNIDCYISHIYYFLIYTSMLIYEIDQHVWYSFVIYLY